MLALGPEDPFASRVGDSKQAVLLSRNPQIGKKYSILHEGREMQHENWDERNNETLTLLYQTAKEILKGERNPSR